MPLTSLPLEEDLARRLRTALAKMGYLTWSGRVAIYDPSPEASAERAARGWPPFIPSLEPGCPDILGIFPGGFGRLFGAECKRGESDKERVSQKKWRDRAEAWGVFCIVPRSVEEAITSLEAERARMKSEVR